MVVASCIAELVHPITRCDRAAIAIIVEVDELFLTTPSKMSRNHFYLEPDFRPETPPFFESAFSFNAYSDGR
jgi:hypothetical protein